MIAQNLIRSTALAGVLLNLWPGLAQAQATAPAAAQETPALTSENDKLSYALGMDYATQLRNYSVEVDPDLFVRGLMDARSGSKALLTEEQVRAALTDMRSGLGKKQLALQNEKLLKSTKEGQAFLAENKGKEGVITLESGLQYKILKSGGGKKPTIDDTVVCHFRATHIDGTEFASSYTSTRPATFEVKKVIKGWAEALQLMPVGSKWQLFIPSNLAYGARGVSRRVGPNAAVIFEMELVAIKKTVSDKTQALEKKDSKEGAPSVNVKAPASSVTAINVSFKLDPRTTQGLYMGERWVSPPKFNSAQTGKSITVDARAHGLNARGRTSNISPKWLPADPEMVTVTPSEGNAVTITVHRAGESGLRLTSQGISRDLAIKAEYLGKTIQVEIAQK